jgi:hypothetical protein
MVKEDLRLKNLRLKNRGHEVQLDEDILRLSGSHMQVRKADQIFHGAWSDC